MVYSEAVQRITFQTQFLILQAVELLTWLVMSAVS